MKITSAVSRRIGKLLLEKNMSLYRLEQNSGILHGAMMCIVKEKNKDITLGTIYKLARGFDMTMLEFLDDEIFRDERLEID